MYRDSTVLRKDKSQSGRMAQPFQYGLWYVADVSFGLDAGRHGHGESGRILCPSCHAVGVVHGLLQTAYLITKTDCSRCLEWPLAAITGSFRHPAGVFSCRLGREDRPKLAGECLIRRRCAASPTCLGSTSDLYSPGAVRPRYCGILRRLQSRVPACGGSRTGHDSAA